MEIYKREGGQTLWVGRNEEGKEVWGWSTDRNGVPSEPARLIYDSEKMAGYGREEDLKDTFFGLPFPAKKAVLDIDGSHMSDAWIFPAGDGWGYCDCVDGWRPITKEDAERLVGPLVSA